MNTSIDQVRMLEQTGVTFLVPAYNEEGAIAAVLSELSAISAALTLESEILVVDDGSQDQTRARAAELDGVKVLGHRGNQGYGAALKTGIRHAQHDLVLILDADGTYSAADVKLLLDEFRREDCDMVVGARTGPDASIPWLRRPAKWAINRLASFVAGERIPDVNSGMRLFPKALAETFLSLLPDGFSFTTTLTLALLTHGYLVRYVRVQYSDRTGDSKIRPIADTMGFVQLILRLALFFAPLKVFLPLAGTMFGLAVAWAVGSWFLLGRLADASTAVIAVASVQIAVLGLLAELINARLPRHDERAGQYPSDRE